MKIRGAVLCLAAALSATAVAGEPETKTVSSPAATNGFAAACRKAWVKGVTGKDPTAYAVGEDIVFTLTLEGVTNAVPKDLYSFKWKRTGDDGQSEEGLAPLESAPFAYTTKSEKAGWVRFTAEIVGKDGAPLAKTVGKDKVPLRFAGGALVDPGALVPPAEDKDAGRFFKELLKRAARPNFKKVERTKVELDGLNGATLSRVELPSPTAHALKGLLSVPESAQENVRMPCRLRFSGTGYDQDVPLPGVKDVSLEEVVLTLAYDFGSPESRDEAFCSELYLEVVRALQYLKSVPEWDGANLRTDGRGNDGLMAVWAASSGEGVNELLCGNVPAQGLGRFAPAALARRIAPFCKVSVPRAGLGDDQCVPTDAVLFWNALSGDRSMVWMQGADARELPPFHEGRDVRWEKLTPVPFVGLTPEHAKVESWITPPFKDVEMALEDKIVLEIVFDYAKPADLNLLMVNQFKGYATEQLVPFEIYAVIPEKKVKAKPWVQFREYLKKLDMGTFPFPVYLNTGLAVPHSETYPWFNLRGQDGAVRYSGPDFGKLRAAYQGLVAKVASPDPIFAFATPRLLKDFCDKMLKSGLPGSKMHKALEAEMRKCLRKDPARAEEARHLMLGMRQAVEGRIAAIQKDAVSRPGRAHCRIQELIAEWPDQAENPGALSVLSRASGHPEIEKLAKLEKELVRLQSWHPEKSAEIKKRDLAMDALRKKVARMGKSKDAVSQGEALLIQADIDNPPQEQQQQ